MISPDRAPPELAGAPADCVPDSELAFAAGLVPVPLPADEPQAVSRATAAPRPRRRAEKAVLRNEVPSVEHVCVS